LGIGELDPLRFRLRPERFLHAGREGAPDIDLDVADQCRGPLFTWLVRRYRKEHVARVGLYDHWREKRAFRAAALVHGLAKPQLDALGEDRGSALDGLRNRGGRTEA